MQTLTSKRKLVFERFRNALTGRLANKLFVPVTTIVLLVVALLSVVSDQLLRGEAVRHSIDGAANNLLLVNRNVQDYMDGIAQFTLPQLQYDDLIHAVLNEENDYGSRMYLESYLRRMFYSRGDLDGLELYIAKSYKTYFVTREAYNVVIRSEPGGGTTQSDWYERLLERPDNQLYRSLLGLEAGGEAEGGSANDGKTPAAVESPGDSSQPEESSFLAYHRVLRSIASRQPQAVLTVYANSSALSRIVSDTPLEQGEHLVLLGKDGDPYYVDDAAFYRRAGQDSGSGLAQQLERAAAGPVNWKLGRDGYLLMANESAQGGWTLAKPMPYRHIYEAADRARRLNILIGAGFVLLSAALVAVVSGAITRPLARLARRMNRFSAGDFETQAPVRGRDEIAHLTRHFNDMVQRTNELINERYRMKLVEQSAILKALEAELNPHFLYNALQAISTQALRGGRLDIADMVDDLAQSLRYCIGGSDIVPASDELRHIERYLSLQKARFGSRLRVEYAWSESLLNLRIPRLSVQSLVENSIKHALEQVKGTVTITIRAERTAGGASITVSDDGPGIRPERLKEVLESLEKPFNEREGDHIGLQNLHTRLQILYGEQAGLEIQTDGGGTRLILNIPQGGEEDV
ncbi:sensor histidine kinase [Saccharibacillus sp. CPCC 101409]|uniref:sensor histidine kinase n=1 Tax=Saccharibacillus sp. CPCC 101409 TaxID=3058041 RepID=UPI002673E595|nr:sensor histidine kinase [Saccharibacillus sp. CPCC 101409]MDO3413307.1 sensor histidine kinase [Saccharibacillus sp. CPCC 101409]